MWQRVLAPTVIMLSLVLTPAASAAAAQAPTSPPPPSAPYASAEQRARLLALAAEIRTADYAGDLPRLAALAGEVSAIRWPAELASPAAYWQGFAHWRRAINGFNETPLPDHLDADLASAVTAFERIFDDPVLGADAESAASACLMSRAFLASQANPSLDWRPWIERVVPLMKSALAKAPDNPRVAWVRGAQMFYVPKERGGGAEVALEILHQGLADAAAERAAGGACEESLAPRWGLPEMLLNLAYFESARPEPELGSALAYARSALALVPSWHYVRDVLIPQLEGRIAAAKKPASP